MDLKTDFNFRVEEVEIYFSFAKEIDSVETHKQNQFQINGSVLLTIKRDLQKVIRANCYLLLYNFIEATIRHGIWAIYDSISDDKISYQELSPQIRKLWLLERASEIGRVSNQKKIKDQLGDLLDERLNEIGINFSKESVSISGNLDYKTIEKFIGDFGCFGKIREIDKIKLGKALLKIKSERNALAHGNKSFRKSAEVVTIGELFEYKKLVVGYLSDVTKNIAEYIEKKGYKK